jgi:hypothetical protein
MITSAIWILGHHIYDRIGVTVMGRAANHTGSWGLGEFWFSGPLGTPARTRWVLSRLEKWHTKRARTSARTFGSPVRRAAAHCVITPGEDQQI